MGLCISCGAAISSGSSTCASCGAPQRQQGSGGSGGFCGQCGATLKSKYSPCLMCGHTKTTYNPQPAPPPTAAYQHGQPAGGASGFCSSCGAALIGKSTTCMKCGYTKTKFNPQQGAMQKSSGTTLLLSILLGLLIGCCGVGHLYLGKIGPGIGMLIGGWVLIVVGILTGGIGLIAYLALFIYSIIDSNKQCKIYNEFVSKNGRPPW
tara:strand:+ start:268 stop:888 length:621 start_codon:yes stop_codon:yes gene_type:complete